VVYDLGCGNGGFLLEAMKYDPQKCVGYEISPWAYLMAVCNTLWHGGGKIIIKPENFLKADISSANIIYVYLVKTAVAVLNEKFKKELKPGVKFVCIGSKMPGWEPIKEIILNGDYKAYLYEKI